MIDHECPDSPRFARRIAAVIEIDLAERADDTNFTNSPVNDVWDERQGIHTYQIEYGSPDGSRALVTVTPQAAVYGR